MTNYDRLGRTEMLAEYRRKNMKCIVFGCVNHNHQGAFVGNLCSPCHSMIVSGEPKYGQTFVHEMQERVAKLEVALRSIEEFRVGPSGQTVAERVMRKLATKALKEATND